jgi:hypothetical protein
MRDEQAHRGFKARVVTQLLHVEKQPRIIERDCGRAVEQFGVHTFVACPAAQFDSGKVRLVHDSFVLVFIAPLSQLIP